MIKPLSKNEVTPDQVHLTHKVGSINDLSYEELVSVLGEPTYPDASGDDKVQKEWVILFNGQVFTIYDWKTYDERYTMEENTDWNVGGKSTANYFIGEIYRLLNDRTIHNANQQ